MESNKENILKNLLQTVRPDKPAVDFTKVVMQEIQAAAREEVVENQELKVLLQVNAKADVPVADFTYNIMAQVAIINRQTSTEPIISKKTRYIFTVIVLLIMAVIALTGPTTQSSTKFTYHILSFGNTFRVFISQVTALPPLYLISLISINFLIMTDYFVNNKLLYQKEQAL